MTKSRQQALAAILMIILTIALALSLTGCAGIQAANAPAQGQQGARESDATSLDFGRLEGSYKIEASMNALGQEVYTIAVPYEATTVRLTLAGDNLLIEILDRGKATLIIRERGTDIVNIPGLVR